MQRCMSPAGGWASVVGPVRMGAMYSRQTRQERKKDEEKGKEKKNEHE